MAIGNDSMVQQSPEQICAEVDGEVVMMNIAQGNYYGLDSVGGRIWELIAQPRRVNELCDDLMREYAVDRAACEADVLRFLDHLAEHKLITVQPA